MPRNIPNLLKAHYALGTTTIAQCWRAQLRDGTVIASTTHSADLTIDGVLYVSSVGYTPSNIESSSDLSYDNMEVDGYLASPQITLDDVHSGRWDYAEIVLFEVNYKKLSDGINILRTGTLGQVKAGRSIFTAELRGLTQKYARRIVQLTTQECNADFGDARCKVDLTNWTVYGSVASVSGNRVITALGLGSSTPSPPPSPSPSPSPSPTPAPAPVADPQGQIDAAASGAVLDMTGGTYSGTLVINKPLTLKGLTVNSPSGSVAITVTASDVTLDRITLQGPQATTYDAGAIGVNAFGTSSTPIYRLKVLDCVITRYGNSGITTNFVNDAQILRNRVEDIVYSGMMILSANGGLVQGNAVRRIGVFGASANSNNAYGVAISTNNPSVNPKSQDVTVDSNLVEDVPTWNALDTHAGIRIQFTNNVVRGSYRGIFITSDSAGRTNQDCLAHNNRIEAPATNDGWAIQIVSAAGGTVTNNNMIGWPQGTNVLQQFSTGLVISGNINNSSAPAPASEFGPASGGSPPPPAPAPGPAPGPAPAPSGGSGSGLSGAPADYYTGGLLTFTTGLNAGLSMEVKSSQPGLIELIEAMPYRINALTSDPGKSEPPAPPDQFKVYAGCMKRFYQDCIGKFNNGLNFRGFPHLPGAGVFGGPGTVMTPATVPGSQLHSPPPPPVPGPAPGPAPMPPGALANKVLGCYFTGWDSSIAITSVPLDFNLIYLFNARPVGASGAFEWPAGWSVTPAQVQTCRNRGQKVVLTVGGAGLAFAFTTRSQSTAFVASVKAIIASFGGLDGVDFNTYEQTTATSPAELVWIAQQLKAEYGANFMITSPPAANGTGGPAVNGMAMGSPADLNLMGALADAGALTFAAPQFYDWSYYNGAGVISSIAKQWVERLGASRVVLGLSANYSNGPSLADCIREWNAAVAMYPNLRGAFCWNAQTNIGGGNVWGSTMRALIGSTVVAPPPPAPPALPPPSTGGWGSYPAVPLRSPTPEMWLQTGSSFVAWAADNPWGAANLRRGTFTDVNGSTYESAYGVSYAYGPNGEVDARFAWKWPHGTTEVKSYPALLYGRKPGYYSPSNLVDGKQILLPDGTISGVSPSGATPGTILPVAANGRMSALNCSFDWQHNVTPSGQGHLSFDIWLQDRAQQTSGFGVPPITHEIMIPLDYWGNYGAHPNGRNPAWYSHDVTMQGVLWHVYMAYPFSMGWRFIVFEPHAPLTGRTLNLAEFVNYLPTRGWAKGTEWLASVELGIEPVYGIGDLTIKNFRVW